MSIRNNLIIRKPDLKSFCIYRLMFGLSYSLMLPVMPLFFDSIGTSTVMIGTIMSLYGISEMLTQIPFGVLSEIIGDKSALKISLGLMILIPIGYTLTTDKFLAGSLHIIQGGIFGMAMPATFSILARSIDSRRRGTCTGVASAVFTFGGGLGAAIAGVIISKLNNYNIIFYISSFGLALTLIYVILKIRNVKMRTSKKDKGDSFRVIFKELKRKNLVHKVMLLAGIAFLGDYVYGCVITLLHFYGQDVLGASTAYTSSIISVYLLVFGLGAPFAGFVSDKIGNKRQLLMAFCIMNLSLVGLVITRSIPVFTIIILMYFIGATCLNAVLQSSLSEFGDEHKVKGFVFGVVGAIESLGYALGPLVSSYLYDINKNLLFVGLLVISMIVTLLYVCSVRKIKI